jgi:hypothetical protein
LHRISHLERYFSTSKPPVSFYPQLPTKQELRYYELGQLSLFPTGSPNTLQWQKDKVDFVELFVAVFESNSVKAINGQKLSKKDYFLLIMWFFNVEVRHLHGTLNAAKARKIDKGSPYLNELVRTFSEYVERGI